MRLARLLDVVRGEDDRGAARTSLLEQQVPDTWKGSIKVRKPYHIELLRKLLIKLLII